VRSSLFALIALGVPLSLGIGTWRVCSLCDDGLHLTDVGNRHHCRKSPVEEYVSPVRPCGDSVDPNKDDKGGCRSIDSGCKNGDN